MAGQKFEYDETGKSFLYFILSFLALILIPSSFYLWPKKQSKGKKKLFFITSCVCMCMCPVRFNLRVITCVYQIVILFFSLYFRRGRR